VSSCLWFLVSVLQRVDTTPPHIQCLPFPRAPLLSPLVVLHLLVVLLSLRLTLVGLVVLLHLTSAAFLRPLVTLGPLQTALHLQVVPQVVPLCHPGPAVCTPTDCE